METENKAPQCIGIIMDGNRRWARECGLPTAEGHRAGYTKAKEVAKWCRDAGVKNLILYAFSNENWNRSPEEVSYLVDIFNTTIFSEAESLRKENGAIRFIGDISRFGDTFVAQAKLLEETNPENPSITIAIALSYGGRQEIVRAVNKILKESKKEVTEADIAEHLYTRGLPDPDLIIRTSGEQRLSNFLPWQSVYSELFFTPTYWPAFEKEEFEKILAEFASRERRIGT
jgi:undecaprenyl diphosphate synthase